MALENTQAVTDAAQTAFIAEPIAAKLGLASEDLAATVQLARGKLAEGRDVEALQIFCGLTLMDPMNMDIQIGLAEAGIAAGAPEISLQCAALVMTQHPDWPEGYFLSGRACMVMGEHDAAREDFAEAMVQAEGKNSALAAEARRLIAICEAKLQGAEPA